MVQKINVKKSTKKNSGWTDIKIEANGKSLEISINEEGYALIHSHSSDMCLKITGGYIYKTKLTQIHSDGSPYELQFIRVKEDLKTYHESTI